VASICLISIPLKAEKVRVKGIGVAPVKAGDREAARKVALQHAKRDAVERAIGAEVLVEAIPGQELTRVVAAASGRISFEITSEQEADGVYIVEIKAEVEVPPELGKNYPEAAEQEGTGYAPLVQPFPHGEVNWEEGYLIARGSAKLSGKDAKSRAEARRAARLDAYAMALQMVTGINLDPEQTAKERIEKAPSLEYRLRGLIRGGEVIEERTLDGVYQVSLKVEMRGIKGVQQAFLDVMDHQGPEKPARKSEDAPTGVIVDARGLKLEPAMFPEIVDEKGDPVYDIGMVEASALKVRGAAAYVTGREQEEGGKGAFIIPGCITVSALAVIPHYSALGLNSGPLLAQAVRPRIVLRQGPRPVVQKAEKSGGPTRSRIVISDSAARTIRQADQRNNFLRYGRVVVITESMIGGTEGKRRKTLWITPAVR